MSTLTSHDAASQSTAHANVAGAVALAPRLLRKMKGLATRRAQDMRSETAWRHDLPGIRTVSRPASAKGKVRGAARKQCPVAENAFSQARIQRVTEPKGGKSVRKAATSKASAGAAQTSLHDAVIENDLRMIRNCIKGGSNPNLKNHLERTPLHAAAFADAPRIIGILVKAQADLEAQDSFGMTPLHVSAMHNSLEATKALIKAGANQNAVDANDMTPLHIAAFFKSTDVVDALLAAKADLDAENLWGITPLHLAVFKKSLPISKALITRVRTH